MGAKCYACKYGENINNTEGNINLSHFVKKYPIGRGGYALVWKVQLKQNNKIYAMKEISKVKAYLKKWITSLRYEKHILTSLHHNFISNLNFSFQDEENLYLILDYFPGGDLRFYMNQGTIFSQSQIKFFISNIILALNYIHNNNIIHRDIKPENLMFDGRGYLHLIDFGIARKIRKDKPINDRSGTPGYFAPEVIMKKSQDFSSDFFSVGVICYELIFGKKPFKGENKKEMAEEILYKKIKIKKNDIPNELGDDIEALPNFINSLLRRNKKERLGYKGIDEIKKHKWLEGIDWSLVENKKMENIPFIPSIGDNFNINYVNEKDNIHLEHHEYIEYLKKINQAEIFKHFYFNYYSLKLLNENNNNYILKKKSSISSKNTNDTDGNISNNDEIISN